jgi:hypothetical protein
MLALFMRLQQGRGASRIRIASFIALGLLALGGVVYATWLAAGRPGAAAQSVVDFRTRATAAALDALGKKLSDEYSVVAGSIRVLDNAEARGMSSLELGGRDVAIERRRVEGDPLCLVVAGVVATREHRLPFVAYLHADPETSSFSVLAVELLDPVAAPKPREMLAPATPPGIDRE